MARIKRIAEDSEAVGSVSVSEKKERIIDVTLSAGLNVKFRPVVLEDVIALRKANIEASLELALRFATRTCLKWGDLPGVTLVQLNKIPLRDTKTISEALGINKEHEVEEERITKLADNSIHIVLSDDSACVFRDGTAEDGITAQRFSKDFLEQTAKLASLTCTQWGDRNGITYEDFLEIEYTDYLLIDKALEGFLR